MVCRTCWTQDKASCCVPSWQESATDMVPSKTKTVLFASQAAWLWCRRGYGLKAAVQLLSPASTAVWSPIGDRQKAQTFTVKRQLSIWNNSMAFCIAYSDDPGLQEKQRSQAFWENSFQNLYFIAWKALQREAWCGLFLAILLMAVRIGIDLIEVNPAYTSRSAKMKYCRIRKIPVHNGAVNVIVRRVQGTKTRQFK